MTVVKINAITVPDGQGPELEARFAARFAQGCMGGVAGFGVAAYALSSGRG